MCEGETTASEGASACTQTSVHRRPDRSSSRLLPAAPRADGLLSWTRRRRHGPSPVPSPVPSPAYPLPVLSPVLSPAYPLPVLSPVPPALPVSQARDGDPSPGCGWVQIRSKFLASSHSVTTWLALAHS